MDEAVQIVVGGEAVEGKVVFLTFNDIRVEITQPFEGVSQPCHIPYFALPLMQYERDGVLTSRGRETSRRLLREIYDACVFCEANEEELLLECQKFLEQGTWSLLVKALSDCDFSAGWYLLPVFLLGFLFTDWGLVWQCQEDIADKFSRRLPEELVSGLVARARWLADRS